MKQKRKLKSVFLRAAEREKRRALSEFECRFLPSENKRGTNLVCLQRKGKRRTKLKFELHFPTRLKIV